MQKILYFELATALQGRPKTFRFITLVLLSFSIAVIVFSAAQISLNEKDKQAAARRTDAGYAEAAVPANGLLHLKK